MSKFALLCFPGKTSFFSVHAGGGCNIVPVFPCPVSCLDGSLPGLFCKHSCKRFAGDVNETNETCHKKDEYSAYFSCNGIKNHGQSSADGSSTGAVYGAFLIKIGKSHLRNFSKGKLQKSRYEYEHEKSCSHSECGIWIVQIGQHKYNYKAQYYRENISNNTKETQLKAF